MVCKGHIIFSLNNTNEFVVVFGGITCTLSVVGEEVEDHKCLGDKTGQQTELEMQH